MIRFHRRDLKDFEPPTYTEKEEAFYSKRVLGVSERQYSFILIMLIIFVGIMSSIAARCEASDGAGSKWTCRYCGYKDNYVWQNSCYRCGKWR